MNSIKNFKSNLTTERMAEIRHLKSLFEEWLRDNESDSEDDCSLDEFYEEENDYFYVNTCHICHCLDKQKRLKRCTGCYMISYCGSLHQAKHWPVHKKLCKVVREVISGNGGHSVFGKTKGMCKKNFTKVKVNAMLVVSLKLGRSLYPNEKNMFKFPRVCCVCHESNPNVLTNCTSCGNSSFCKDHVSDSKHQSLCPTFNTCYRLDVLKSLTIEMTIAETCYTLLKSEPIDFVPFSPQIVQLPPQMRKFLDIYFKKIVNIRREKAGPEYWDMYISEYFTRPLTLISAMEIINFEPKQDFVIHVLGSNNLDMDSISSWEIILHWIPNIQKLKVVLIGPETWACHGEAVKPDLCVRCKSKKKSFEVEIYRVFYHDYVHKGYTTPDLVIGYNIGISEFENPGSPEDTWKPTILSLTENKTPFIMTAYVEEEARKEHKRMCNFLGSSTNYRWFAKNQFASLKPVRDFESEEVFYQNNHLIIYNNLQDNSKNKTNNLKKKNSVKAESDMSSMSDKENNPKKIKNVPISNCGENKDCENDYGFSMRHHVVKKNSISSSAEDKKDRNSTSESEKPTLEELREKNKRLKERMAELKVRLS